LGKRTVQGFIRTNRSNPEIIKLEDSIVNYTAQLTLNQILSGAIIGPLQLLAGVTQSVYHGLGREYVGWIVIDTDQPTDIFRDSMAPDDPTLSIPLQAATLSPIVKLYVF